MKERLYDFLNGMLDRHGFGERRRQLVGSLAGDVLEVGAGTGLNVSHYPSGSRVVLLEPDRHYARRLRERAAESPAAVRVVEATAESLPFPEASFDHVVTSLVLCSVADLEGTLGEIRRVLRPGGSLRFLEHVRADGRLGRWQDRLTPLQRRLVDGCHLNRETEAAIEGAGFRFEELEHFTMPPGHPLIKPMIQGAAVRSTTDAGHA